MANVPQLVKGRNGVEAQVCDSEAGLLLLCTVASCREGLPLLLGSGVSPRVPRKARQFPGITGPGTGVHVHTQPITILGLLFSRPVDCDPMDCSTPGLPVHHHLLEFAHIHVHFPRRCHPTILILGLRASKFCFLGLRGK